MENAIDLLQQLRNDPGEEVRRAFSAPYFEFKRDQVAGLPLPEYEEAEVEFRLPYSAVSVDMDILNGGLLSMSDVDPVNAVGLAAPRRFMLVLPLPNLPFLALSGYLGAVDVLRPLLAKEQGDDIAKEFDEALAADPVTGEEVGYRVVITGMSSFACRQPNSEQLKQLSEFAETAVTAAIQCFARLLSPKVVAIESAPADQKSKKQGAKHRIKRYTLIDIRKAGEILRGSVSSSDKLTAERAATLRRGCYHVLRHERYARGEDGKPRRVWCLPCWVGPESAVVGSRRYRVLLNLDYQGKQKVEEVNSI